MSWNIREHRDFSGGENRKLVPGSGANQLIHAQNCVLTPEGWLETRKGKYKISAFGWAGYDSSGDVVVSVHRYAKEDGTKFLLYQMAFASGDHYLYSVQWDGGKISYATNQLLKNNLSGKKLRSVVWKDKIIFTSSGDDPFLFDGTSCTDLGDTPPRSEIITVYASRLWFVDVATGFIRFSELEDYDSWPALNLIKVRDGDGDVITGLSPQPGGIVVLKTRSVWPIYGTDRFTMRVGEPIAKHIGCLGYDCYVDGGMIVEQRDMGMFLGPDNWYGFNLSGVFPLPDTHTPLIQEVLPRSSYLDTESEEILTTEGGVSILAARARFLIESVSGVQAVVQPLTRRILFALPGDNVVCFDAQRNAVTTWTGLNVASFCVANAKDDNGELVIGSNGEIYTLDNETDDDGTPIQTYIKTDYNDEGTAFQKEWREIVPDIEPLTSGDYVVSSAFDVDFGRQKGTKTYAVTVPETGVWDESKWNEAYFGPVTPIDEPFWIHSARGRRMSAEFKSKQRIRHRGYLTKFRQVGTI